MDTGAVAVVVIDAARIDYTTSDDFSSRLDRAVGEGDTPVIVDLSEVTRIDSIGLRALVDAAKRSRAFFAVVAPRPLVGEVLAIGRLDLLFDIYDSLGAARSAALA